MPTLLPRYLPGRLLVLVAVVIVVGSGCSGKGIKKVTVSGTVSYKGQKLQSGILKFVGPEGSYSAASIQPDGTYVITDVVPGEVKVGVMESPRGRGHPRVRGQHPGRRSSPSPCPKSTGTPRRPG